MKWWNYLIFFLALCMALILHDTIKRYALINNKYFKIFIIIICLIIFFVIFKKIIKY